MKYQSPQQQKRDSSLIMLLLISIGIVCIAALLVIGYITRDNLQFPQLTPPEQDTELLTVAEMLANQGELKTFEDYSAAREYLKQQSSASDGAIGIMPMTRNMAVEEFATDSMAQNTSAPLGLGGDGDSKEFSTTNIQVAGVDEADIVKTDGEYVYTTISNQLHIVDAQVEDFGIVSTVELPGNPQELYIHDNTLAVFGYDNTWQTKNTNMRILPRSSMTFFALVDITDKTNPQITRTLQFEGSYIQSRMIGEYVYFITRFWPGPSIDFPLPRLYENDAPLCSDDTTDTVRCPQIQYITGFPGEHNLTTISAISLTDTNKTVTREVIVMPSSHTIYASTNNLYLTSAKYFDQFQLSTEILRDVLMPQLPESYKNRITKIQAVDSDVLSDQEKIQKINQLLQQYLYRLPQDQQTAIQKQIENEAKIRYEQLQPEFEKTIIHSFALDKEHINARASGSVPGTVLNQFSMDEHDGYFRIATTNNGQWLPWTKERSESSSNIFILDENLEQASSIRNIAPGERIYSVRFMQDRAYMVTFEQIDPLFVIDVADPKNPQILGELKIPGFSNYLHPYDETTLIGIGQDTTIDEFDRVRTNGVKISLFDVADVASPIEIDNYIVGEQSSSEAQHNHKAVLFSKEKNLLVVPINTWGDNPFNGVLAFTITEDGIERRGAIEHKNLGNRQYTESIRRSLYIEDLLYTLSSAGMKINNIETLDEQAVLGFPENNYGDPIPLPEPLPVDGPVVF